MATIFDTRTDKLFEQLKEQRVWKTLQMLESPMDAVVRIKGPDGKQFECACFCSNNYLGLANHPEVVEAGLKGNAPSGPRRSSGGSCRSVDSDR